MCKSICLFIQRDVQNGPKPCADMQLPVAFSVPLLPGASAVFAALPSSAFFAEDSSVLLSPSIGNANYVGDV